MTSSQSNVKKLFSQSSHYLIGTGLVTLSHLFTFPILTRIFSVADYGLLSLISITISIAFVISKFGLTSSSVRFYEECRLNKTQFTLDNYYSTFFITAFVAGFLTMLVCFSIGYILLNTSFDDTFSWLLFFAAVIVFLRTIVVIFMSFIRAKQKTITFNLIDIANNYGGAACSILLSLFVIKGLYGFYSGQIIIFLCASLLLFWRFSKNHRVSLHNFSGELFKESYRFGLPLVGLELMNHILGFGDRFFIKIFCDADALGIYSVGYNLSTYISNIILVPLSMTIIPLLMKVWANDGIEATKLFLSNSVRYIALAFCPIIAGFMAVNKELIKLLASEKFSSASEIIPFVLVGIGFLSISQIFNAGIIIYKRTDKIISYSFIAAIINTLLNITLIPRFNIMGAAYATLISYAFYFLIITISAFSFLSFPIPYRKIFLYLAISSLMYIAADMISMQYLLSTLIVKVAFGIFFYIFLVLAFDKEIRLKCKEVIRSGSIRRFY